MSFVCARTTYHMCFSGAGTVRYLFVRAHMCVCVCYECEPSRGDCTLRAHIPGVPHFQLICCSLWLLICLRGARWVGEIRDVSPVTTAEEMQLRVKRWGTQRGRKKKKITPQSLPRPPLPRYTSPFDVRQQQVHTFRHKFCPSGGAARGWMNVSEALQVLHLKKKKKADFRLKKSLSCSGASKHFPLKLIE